MTEIIKIEGMTCGHCVQSAKESLQEIKGIKSVTISLEKANATLELEDISAEEVIQQFNDSTHYIASK